jgi:ASC-1-like (ASCH) protein
LKSSYQEFQEYLNEESIRKQHPDVQAAWERYKVLVELYKTQTPKEIDETQFG